MFGDGACRTNSGKDMQGRVESMGLYSLSTQASAIYEAFLRSARGGLQTPHQEKVDSGRFRTLQALNPKPGSLQHPGRMAMHRS